MTSGWHPTFSGAGSARDFKSVICGCGLWLWILSGGPLHRAAVWHLQATDGFVLQLEGV